MRVRTRSLSQSGKLGCRTRIDSWKRWSTPSSQERVEVAYALSPRKTRVGRVRVWMSRCELLDAQVAGVDDVQRALLIDG